MTSAVRVNYQVVSEEKSFLQETSLRRKLRAELSSLKSLLEPSYQDRMSSLLQMWVKGFLEALSFSCEERAIHQNYISLLKEVLKDPLTEESFNEYALLGSDGITYDYTSLARYMDEVQPEYRLRSPIHFNEEKPFTVTYHPLVPHFVRWRDLYVPSTLKEHKISPFIPMQEDPKVAALKARERARRAYLEKNMRNIREQIDRFEKGIRENVKETFHPILEDLREHHESSLERIDRLSCKDQEIVDSLQQRVNSLNKEIEGLQQENQMIEKTIQVTGITVSQIDKDHQKLQVSINECRVAIKRAQQSSLGGFLGAICAVGLCAVTGVFITAHPSGIGIAGSFAI